jgi:hypothetical protein
MLFHRLNLCLSSHGYVYIHKHANKKIYFLNKSQEENYQYRLIKNPKLFISI